MFNINSINRIAFVIFFNIAVANIVAQTIDASLTQDLMIGFREDSTEYLFSNIKRVCTDAAQNIYIGDGRSQEITKFNKDGYFIEHIGRRGQGPGEIIELTDMVINPDDNLLVLDRRNRRTTVFFKNSQKFDMYPFTGKGCVDPRFVRQMNCGEYFLYYRMNHQVVTGAVFHFFDNDFNQIVDEFDDNGLIWDREDPFACNQIGGAWHDKIWFLSDNEFFLIPWLYHGKIFKFQKKNNTWSVKTIIGFKPKLRSHVQLNQSDYWEVDWESKKIIHKKERPVNFLSGNGPMGSFLIETLRQSRGIFTLNSGIIVHFSEKHKKGNVYIQMIEFFSKEGEFLGYHVYDEKDLSRDDNELLLRAVLSKDSKDRFYFEAVYEDVPVMIRMNLKYSLGE